MVGDCSVTERRRWCPSHQTGKIVQNLCTQNTKHCSTVPIWFLPWGVDLVKQAQLDKKLELALMNESEYNVLYINISLDYRAVGGGRVVRWCWVNFQYNLDYSRARAYCTCSRCGWGLFGHFTLVYPFSPLSPSLWEPARYRLKYCLKGPLNPTQPTSNQIQGRRRLVKSGPAKYPRVPKA